MEQNNELIKEIREVYAKEVGWPSFASMASNVNIVPRDISEIAKRYAEAINKALQAKCDRYEAALNAAKDALENSYDVLSYPATGETLQDKAIATINEALSAGEGEPVPAPANEINVGLKFFNIHMPKYLFQVTKVDRPLNKVEVKITAPGGDQWNEVDWNLEHTHWGFAKGEYFTKNKDQ